MAGLLNGGASLASFIPPSDSVIFETGISRICGGSRFPASMVNRMVRRNGISYRLSANAAIEARSRLRMTAGTVTWMLTHIAWLMPPEPRAVRKPSSVNPAGSAVSPRRVMSSKGRNAMITTKIIGAIHSSESGAMIPWNSQSRPRRLMTPPPAGWRGPGR
jgi:hypothetical protein